MKRDRPQVDIVAAHAGKTGTAHLDILTQIIEVFPKVLQQIQEVTTPEYTAFPDVRVGEAALRLFQILVHKHAKNLHVYVSEKDQSMLVDSNKKDALHQLLGLCDLFTKSFTSMHELAVKELKKHKNSHQMIVTLVFREPPSKFAVQVLTDYFATVPYASHVDVAQNNNHVNLHYESMKHKKSKK